MRLVAWQAFHSVSCPSEAGEVASELAESVFVEGLCLGVVTWDRAYVCSLEPRQLVELGRYLLVAHCSTLPVPVLLLSEFFLFGYKALAHSL